MIFTLLGSIVGFASSAVPELFKIYKDKKDKEHELVLLNLQMAQQEKIQNSRLEEIKLTTSAEEYKNLYRTYKIGNRFVDSFSATVRPVIAYGFFILYATIKVMLFTSGDFDNLWIDEDQMLFAGIVSFYFGNRAISKVRH